MIVEKKIEKSCSLHSFITQTLESSPFSLVDKDSLRTHNQLHAIALPNI